MTPTRRAALDITIASAAGRARACEPITFGLPLPRGWAHDAACLRLTDADERELPLQAAPTERWPDGSIRWVLLDTRLGGRPSGRYACALGLRGEGQAAEPPAPSLVVARADLSVVVDTGRARLRFAPGAAFPFAEAVVDGRSALRAEESGLTVVDDDGATWSGQISRVSVEDGGALRTTVRLDGYVGRADDPLLDLSARVDLFAGSSAARIAVTLRNPRRAEHTGGIWELGDPGSVLVRDAALRLALPSAAATSIECAPDLSSPLERVAAPFELYQDSSGGSHWQSAAHQNRRGEVPCRFRGYRLSAGGARVEGLRATPAIRARHESGTIGLAIEHFWQNFPKALEAGPGGLVLRLFPAQFADRHELQGGEQKTHRLVLALGDDPMAGDALWWGRCPAAVAAPPAWYAASGAVPYLSPASREGDDRYQRLVDAALDGDDSFARKREAIDEYGWRHFGDLYADHENAFSGEPAPIVSHYNNQYDGIAGLACQFFRTGDARWLQAARELAAHVADIDIYHTDRDKAAYNHGLFWHTYHYVAAGASTHRSYPRHPKIGGGGPANEHNYASGLRLHWLLTGDRLSRDVAIGLAQWVVDMDDGRKTVLRWLTAGDTGLASSTHSPGYHGPGRGAGHSIFALLDGHRLTGDRRFLAKAEQLIARSVHPDDDVEALDLLDAERRWSYTVFLQALGQFLDYKAELQQIDASYAYGRAALLRYARWMADREYPYLDKPEILEYPTETWAAQDVRKSGVFWFAALHSEGAERQRFVERARFFYEYSMSALVGSETCTRTRPLAILMVHGFMHLTLCAAAALPAPCAVPAAIFPPPARFVPQKSAAKKRLVATAAAGFAAVVAGLAMLALR